MSQLGCSGALNGKHRQVAFWWGEHVRKKRHGADFKRRIVKLVMERGHARAEVGEVGEVDLEHGIVSRVVNHRTIDCHNSVSWARSAERPAGDIENATLKRQNRDLKTNACVPGHIKRVVWRIMVSAALPPLVGASDRFGESWAMICGSVLSDGQASHPPAHPPILV